MIVDFSISNFRSFKEEQVFSMNVERGRDRLTSNFSIIEDGKLSILRSAAILGANASGKSNLLTAFMALRWIVTSSSGRKESQSIPPYEPFRLSDETRNQPVQLEVEFIVPSGVRYRYEVAFSKNRIHEERLFSFARRVRAVVFERGPEDTWETVKFGGTFKGGARRFPFFSNVAYLSRAGNDASSPEFIREIFKYFQNIFLIPSGRDFFSILPLTEPSTLAAVSELICLADTGVSKITLEERENVDDLKLPEGLPEDLKEYIISENKVSAKYWVRSESGELLPFEDVDMSDGTKRLLEVFPCILSVLESGSALIVDEINAHFHTEIVGLILSLFNDREINKKGSQLIFTTHDTNVLDSSLLRRDQIWFVSKKNGVSSIKSLDEYDRSVVRHDSPFETFYKEGRLGAVPKVSFGGVRDAILKAIAAKESARAGGADAKA